MKKIIVLLLFVFSNFVFAVSGNVKSQNMGTVVKDYNFATSLNVLDGSFEKGVSSAWLASTGSLAAVQSSEFQGFYKGTWTGTGAATLDARWTATASNTYELSAQVRTSQGDFQVCAYVNGAETGCKAFTATNISKVSVIASSWLGSSFYLRLKHTGSDAFSIDVDDGKIEPWSPNYVNTVSMSSLELRTISGTVAKSTSTALYISSAALIVQKGDGLTYVNNGTDGIKVTCNYAGKFRASSNAGFNTNNNANIFAWYKNGSIYTQAASYGTDTNVKVTASFLETECAAGEYYQLRTTDSAINLNN